MLLDTKLLRQKVRDLAVSGKLSNANIKANLLLDDDTYIDFPFSIPDTWQWITLGELVPYGKSDHVSYTDIDANTWVLGLEEVEKHTGKLLAKKRGIEFKSSKSVFYEGNVLFSKVNPHLNKVIVADEDGVCTSEIIPIDVQKSKLPLCARFLQYVLMSSYFVGYSTKKAFGVKMPRLSTVDAKNALIPLPPLEEQKRIVAKVEEIFAELDAIDKAYSELEQLGTLSKSKILDLAIKGQLVPQLDSEPAVEQIGKAPEDVPFDIPEKWKWLYLSNVGRWKSGGTPDRSKHEYYDNGNIPWLKTGDLNDGFIDSVEECITQLGLDNSSAHINPIGSVLIAMYGATIGKLGILNIPCATNQACCACVTEDKIIFNKFLFFYLLSQRRHLVALGAGSGQPNISKTKIINYLIPLPPLEEQKRIVAKVEELFALIDAMKK